MTTIAIICVASVKKTSFLLCHLFGWKSEHGGDQFDNLVNANGRSVLWLHDFESHTHPRFHGAKGSQRGVGSSIYVLVEDIEKIYQHANDLKLEIVEELYLNQNAGFREFTFRLEDGYQFTPFEGAPWVTI